MICAEEPYICKDFTETNNILKIITDFSASVKKVRTMEMHEMILITLTACVLGKYCLGHRIPTYVFLTNDRFLITAYWKQASKLAHTLRLQMTDIRGSTPIQTSRWISSKEPQSIAGDIFGR